MSVVETTIDKVVTPNWQLSTKGLGIIATDGDDILLSIHNILFTIKGELPFKPEFGSLIFEKIDLPANKISAAVSAEVIDAITKHEPRVIINSVKPVLNNDLSMTWTISMTVKASQKPLGYTLNLTNDKQNRRAFSDGFTTEAFG